MLNIDITHAPHIYGIGAAGLVILAAVAILVIELRRVGSVPWPEWHDNRSGPRYLAAVRPLPARGATRTTRTATAPSARCRRSSPT